MRRWLYLENQVAGEGGVDPIIAGALEMLRSRLPKEVVENEALLNDILRCVDSTPHFARFFMPKKFTRPFAPQHKELFEALDDPSLDRVLILAPRGAGKTTIVTQPFAARNILFGLKQFVLLIGASERMMIPKTQDLKAFLQDREMIAPWFGGIHDEQNGVIVPKRTPKDEWETNSGIVVWSKGAEQRIRGALVHGNRPDLIILDDLENSINIISAEWRAKIRDFLFNDIEMMVDVEKRNYKIVMIATMLHHDCLPAHLMEDKAWKVIRFDLCDDDCNSLWPEYMSTKQIADERERAAARGDLASFYRERRNIPSPPETDFRQEMFKYYNAPGDGNAISEQEMNDDPMLHHFILVDPTRTTKATSSEAAIVGGSVDLAAGKVYNRGSVHGHLDPARVNEEIFQMAERINAQVVGVEVTGLGLYAIQPLMNEIARRGIALHVVELHAPGGRNAPSKEDRIRAMLPYYNQGQVYHNYYDRAALEEQELTFPRPRKWDVMDAWSYFPELFMRTERWMVSTKKMDDSDRLAYKRLKQEEKELARINPDYSDYGFDENDSLEAMVGGDVELAGEVGLADEVGLVDAEM